MHLGLIAIFRQNSPNKILTYINIEEVPKLVYTIWTRKPVMFIKVHFGVQHFVEDNIYTYGHKLYNR